MAIFHDECNKWFILYFIFSYCLARCLHSGPDHAVEYGLIFHGTRTVKYYCKNMKYRINIYIRDSQLNRPESDSRSEPLSTVFNDQPRDIYIYK